jgi:hypothetical protein
MTGMLDDRARKKWLLEQLVIETKKYAWNEGKAGDFHLARGNLILDIGEAFDLFSADDKERFHHALFDKSPAAIRHEIQAAEGPQTASE